MGKTVVNILMGIAIGVIPLIYNNYFLSDKPDVGFTLSAPIELSPSKKTRQIIQQIKIKNFGKGNAENIVIQFPGKLSSFEVKKYSLDDSVQNKTESNLNEIKYPSLPPEGEIEIILYLEGRIDENRLNIKHKGGGARNVLSKAYQEAGLLIIAVYCGVLIVVGYATYQDRILNYYFSAHNLPEKILKMKKPIFASKKKWDDIRKDALEEVIRKIKTGSRLGDIQTSMPYVLLNAEKPTYYTDDEWMLVFPEAVNFLGFHFSYQLRNVHELRSFEVLFSISQPLNCPPEKWHAIQKETSDALVRFFERKATYMKIEDMIKQAQQKPKYLNDDVWEEILGRFRDKIVFEVQSNMFSVTEPMQYLGGFNLDVLSDKQRQNLEFFAYKLSLQQFGAKLFQNGGAKLILKDPRPDWIKDSDYELLKSRAEKMI